MSCIGCEYDSFVMWGNKKIPYCKYFKQIKLSNESLCGRERPRRYYSQKPNKENLKNVDIDMRGNNDEK